jgi:hypothetical protein
MTNEKPPTPSDKILLTQKGGSDFQFEALNTSEPINHTICFGETKDGMRIIPLENTLE